MARFTDFFLISNSPGELAGWVRPVVLELKKQIPEATIEIFLTPCQFQSGTEKQYALALPGVSKVWEVRQTLRFC
jgi:lipid-A-disaccharide synthase